MIESVIINARKFDGTIHRSWSCRLLQRKENLLMFVGEFEKEINHNKLGVIRPGTVSYEYYWLDRWYNVFRFHEPNGDFRNFYCNLNLPPIFDNGVLDYIDLDIDVLITGDRQIELLDLDEYEQNSRQFGYSGEIKNKVDSSLSELISLAKNGEFPFDEFYFQ